MEEVSVEQSSTLLADYDYAVLRLAWVVHRRTRERILLCAAVELLPREVPPPPVSEESFAEISANFFVYARNLVTSSERGIAWFDDAYQGRAVRPSQSGTLPRSDDMSAPQFKTGMFAVEPGRESFVTSTSRVPFSSDWHVTPRVRHLVSDVDPFAEWHHSEKDAAKQWLKAKHHVDLLLFPEYAGSIHLIAPNPIFRELSMRIEREDSGRDAILFALTLRRNMSAEGLELILEEKRATGVCILGKFKFTDSVLRVRLAHRPGEVRQRIIDNRRGLLLDGGFAVFILGFSLETRLVSQIRRVEPGNPAEAYEVAISTGTRRADPATQAAERSARAELSRASSARRVRALAEDNQRWFRNRAGDGVKALRELIGDANETLFVCDPYFGGDDLLRVILAIANTATPVQILTSAMYLRMRRGVGTDLLERRLEEVRKAPSTNPLEVRVMMGKKPAIHDRLIVTASKTWALGSSLNNYGERGTLMLAVPDPDPVREDLLRVWESSKVFETWLVERKAAKGR